jgi:hypothetical protein
MKDCLVIGEIMWQVFPCAAVFEPIENCINDFMIANDSWSRDFLFWDEDSNFVELVNAQIGGVAFSFHEEKSTSWHRLQIGSIAPSSRSISFSEIFLKQIESFISHKENPMEG